MEVLDRQRANCNITYLSNMIKTVPLSRIRASSTTRTFENILLQDECQMPKLLHAFSKSQMTGTARSATSVILEERKTG
jgi:hypothetical protein